MRRFVMVLVAGMTLGLSTMALAADPAPDCSEKQKALDDSKAAARPRPSPICRAARR